MAAEHLLEKYLLDNIPITSAMGVKVVLATSERVVLSAPLSNNINHKKTVFGGSIHAVATLSCWSLLHVILSKLYPEDVQIVISHSSVDYLLAVTSDFRALNAETQRREDAENPSKTTN